MRWLALLALAGCGRYSFELRNDARAGDGGVGDDATQDGPLANVNYVFVTSTTIVPAALGSVGNADQVCNNLAQQRGLPGTYVAWLSSLSSDVVDRMNGARGWQRLDGLPFADSVTDLAATRFFYPIVVDETSALRQGVSMVTNTNTNGRILGINDCTGFTSTTGLVNGTNNANGATYWTLGAGYSCDSILHMYCFGIDFQTPVAAPGSSGAVRHAFVTDGMWTPGLGIADADAFCQTAANANSIAGTFRALLATNGSTAASRFDLGGPPWVRLDGTAFVSPADQLAAYLLTSLHQTPTMYVNGGAFAWFGALSSTTAGDATSSCNDWNANQPNVVGRSTSVATLGPAAYFGTSLSCDTAGRLLCRVR